MTADLATTQAAYDRQQKIATLQREIRLLQHYIFTTRILLTAAEGDIRTKKTSVVLAKKGQRFYRSQIVEAIFNSMQEFYNMQKLLIK